MIGYLIAVVLWASGWLTQIHAFGKTWWAQDFIPVMYKGELWLANIGDMLQVAGIALGVSIVTYRCLNYYIRKEKHNEKPIQKATK